MRLNWLSQIEQHKADVLNGRIERWRAIPLTRYNLPRDKVNERGNESKVHGLGRQVIYGPVSQLAAGSRFKLCKVWVQIPPGLPRVDVCAIFSASKKSNIVGFAGLARKPANIWKQRFTSQCFHHLFNVDSRAISRVFNVTLCWQRSKSRNQSPNSRLGG